MFIIEDNVPYLIEGENAYKVSFGENGQTKVDKENFVNVKDQHRYTYDETIRKFNVNYLIARKKKEIKDNKEIATLKTENEKLTKKVAELEAKLAKKNNK